MSSKNDKVCIDNLKNLRSLANATNEELQTLHTKHLFSNFCTNQFEFLLEDIAKGNFDESRLQLVKRVNWHILNSMEMKKNQLSFEWPTAEIEHFHHCIKGKAFSGESNEMNYNEKLTYLPSKLKSVNTLQMKDKTSESTRRWERLHFPKWRDSHRKIEESTEKSKSPHFRTHSDYSSFKLFPSKKNARIQDKARKISMSNKTQKKSGSAKVKVTETAISLPYSFQPTLQKFTIPNINIPPMNKSTQFKLNILPSKTFEKRGKKIRMESALKYEPTLQIFNNKPIDILPLTEQRQPNITIPAGLSNEPISINQGHFVFKHPQLHPERDEELEVDNLNHSWALTSEEGHSSQKISPKDDISDALINEEITEMNFQEDEFDPEKFMDRLEEKLSAVLVSLPVQSYERKSDPLTNKFDIGTRSRVSTSSQTASILQVSVQTQSPEAAGNSELMSLHSNNSKSSEHLPSDKNTSTLHSSKKDSFPKNAADSSEDMYSEKGFEESYDDSLIPSQSETKERKGSENEREFQNKEMGHATETDATSPEHVQGEFAGVNEVKEEKDDEKVDEKVKIDEDDFSSSLAYSPSKQGKLCSLDESGLPSHLSPTASKAASQERLNSKESSHDSANESPSSSSSRKNSEDHLENVSVSITDGNDESEMIEMELEEKLSEQIIPPEEPKNMTCSSPSFPSDQEGKPLSPRLEKTELDKKLDTDSVSNLEKSASSESSTYCALVRETASVSAGEAILPSVEIGDVTVSDGEIEFEASFSDLQPGNHIAIKFSTRDFGLLHESSTNFPHRIGMQNSSLVSKETQTLNVKSSEVVGDSFSDEIILGLDDLEAAAEASEDVTTLNNYSEGEVPEEGSPRSSSVSSDEIRSLGRENEILRRRLASFTGRFCFASRHQKSSSS